MNLINKSHFYNKNNTVLFRLHSFITKSNNIHDFLRRFITLLSKLHFPNSFCSKLYDIHYKYISFKLNNLFNSAYILTKKQSMSCKTNQNSNIIWVLWYQGFSNMPPLVKKCFFSLKEHAKGHKIILLTKYNIKNYAILPSFIFYKLKKKDMNLTEFSDILRFNLLRHYGGIWVDSTIFFVSDLSKECFNSSLFTSNSKYLMVPHSNMSLGRWTEFFIGGKSNQPLFIFMDNVFKLYWNKSDSLIDYFLADCALNFAYMHNIGGFYNYVNSLKPNPFVFQMVNIGNDKCNYKNFIKLINKATYFKLSYKQKIKKTDNTFYNFLLK